MSFVVNHPGLRSRLLLAPLAMSLPLLYVISVDMPVSVLLGRPAGIGVVLLFGAATLGWVAWATPMLMVQGDEVRVTDWFRYLLKLGPVRTIALDSIERVVVRKFHGGNYSRAGYGVELHLNKPGEAVELRFGRPKFHKNRIQKEIEPLLALVRARPASHQRRP